MISEYLEEYVILAQLKHHFPLSPEIDWNRVLESGRLYKGYIAYYIASEGIWLLTNYMTGFVEDVVFGEDLENEMRNLL